jgi:hypothetical protein
MGRDYADAHAKRKSTGSRPDGYLATDLAGVAAWHGHDEVTMRRTYSHITPDQLAEIGQALSG